MSDDLIARRVLQEQQGCESKSGILTFNRCYFKHDFSSRAHTCTHTHLCLDRPFARLCSSAESYRAGREFYYHERLLAGVSVRGSSISCRELHWKHRDPVEAPNPPAIVTIQSDNGEFSRLSVTVKKSCEVMSGKCAPSQCVWDCFILKKRSKKAKTPPF